MTKADEIVMMDVVATEIGTFAGQLVKPGTRLTIPATGFSPKWMKAPTQADTKKANAELRRRKEAAEVAKGPGIAECMEAIAELKATVRSMQSKIGYMQQQIDGTTPQKGAAKPAE